MLIDKSQYDPDCNIEFLFERPVGWSSACLDSTISYYLDCSLDNSEKEREYAESQVESI